MKKGKIKHKELTMVLEFAAISLSLPWEKVSMSITKLSDFSVV